MDMARLGPGASFEDGWPSPFGKSAEDSAELVRLGCLGDLLSGPIMASYGAYVSQGHKRIYRADLGFFLPGYWASYQEF